MNSATQSQLTQDQINKAVAAGLAKGKTHAAIAAELGIARRSNPMIVAFRLAEGHADLPAASRGRARSFNGKTNPTRQRELKGRKKVDNYPQLLKVQLLISQLCSVLEGVDLAEYGIDEVSLWRVNDIYDDLLSLATWVDLTTGRLQGWLGDTDVLKRIEMLRDTRGRTEEEAKAYTQLADKLERKLQRRLIPG